MKPPHDSYPHGEQESGRKLLDEYEYFDERGEPYLLVVKYVQPAGERTPFPVSILSLATS